MTVVREAGEVEVVVVRDHAVLEQHLDDGLVAGAAVCAGNRAAERRPTVRPVCTPARLRSRVRSGFEQELGHCQQAVGAGGLELMPARRADGVQGGPSRALLAAAREARITPQLLA